MAIPFDGMFGAKQALPGCGRRVRQRQKHGKVLSGDACVRFFDVCGMPFTERSAVWWEGTVRWTIVNEPLIINRNNA